MLVKVRGPIVMHQCVLAFSSILVVASWLTECYGFQPLQLTRTQMNFAMRGEPTLHDNSHCTG